jgi:hypothetical protein
MNPKTGLLFSFLLKPRRILLCLSIVLALFIFQHIFTAYNATTHVIDDDDTKPRFLYRSHFRDNPDFDYEKRISNALQGVERDVLAGNGGDTLAEERIWQIARDEDQRGEDSQAFERQNRVWRYSVSSPNVPFKSIDYCLADDEGS